MREKSLYVFLLVFAVMFLGSMAINFFTDRIVYFAPVIGAAGVLWSVLRLKGVTRIGGFSIGSNDDTD